MKDISVLQSVGIHHVDIECMLENLWMESPSK
jgi:hypothetical protein